MLDSMTAPTSRPLSPGAGPSKTVMTAKPPLTPQELRLECAKLAVALSPPASKVVDICQDIYRFVMEGA
jgi:hypothetical protein